MSHIRSKTPHTYVGKQATTVSRLAKLNRKTKNQRVNDNSSSIFLYFIAFEVHVAVYFLTAYSDVRDSRCHGAVARQLQDE